MAQPMIQRKSPTYRRKEAAPFSHKRVWEEKTDGE